MRATVVLSARTPAGGEQTAERSGNLATTVLPASTPTSVHTVSMSTPTEQRIARSRRHAILSNARSISPLARLQRDAHKHALELTRTVVLRSNQRDHDDAKCDEQRAGEDTLTRSDGALRSNMWSSGSALGTGSGSKRNSMRSVNTDAHDVGGNNVQEGVLSRMATLKVLLDEGFISSEEYDRRKCAIMDELTFGSNLASNCGTYTQDSRHSVSRGSGIPLIMPHAPDFVHIVPEVATKHVFNYDTRQWTTSQVYVSLDETPFSKGSLRVVYHLQDLNEIQCDGSYVAKVAIDPDEDPQTYFRDIELQAHCAFYASVYNSYHPPKRVEFLHAWVLELNERDGVLCAVEEYIPGDYRKHNNNFGSVSEDDRNTPQAFSHFTYEASNHELLAVDIQGVGDKYTDPQIHTLNGHDFGKGNLGALGFQKFLSSHRCNSICRYLKLPSVNPKDRHTDHGTLPLQELMNRDRIRPTRFDSKHYYESAPMLQKYITHCREMEDRHRIETESESMSSKVCTRLSICGCALQ